MDSSTHFKRMGCEIKWDTGSSRWRAGRADAPGGMILRSPVLAPGDSWEYESGTSLPTPTGSMHGSFQFDTLVSASGQQPLAFSGRVDRDADERLGPQARDVVVV